MKKKIFLIATIFLLLFSVTVFAESKTTTETAISASVKNSRLPIGEQAELSLNAPSEGTLICQWYGSKDDPNTLYIIDGATEKNHTSESLEEGVYYYACKYNWRLISPEGIQSQIGQSNAVMVIVGNPPNQEGETTGGNNQGETIKDLGGNANSKKVYNYEKGNNAELSIIPDGSWSNSDLIVSVRKSVENTRNGTEDVYYTVPLSLYKNGLLKFIAPETGTYMIKYNYVEYSDIKNHWAEKQINFVTAREIFKGIGNGLFSPDKPVTKGMFATVLSRISGEIQKTNYSDGYFMEAVVWACENGIAPNRNMQYFREDENITREEMAIMISNYLKYAKINIDSEKSEMQFSDIDRVDPKFVSAVCKMQDLDLLFGNDKNMFNPRKTATRAEVAAVIERLIKIIMK